MEARPDRWVHRKLRVPCRKVRFGTYRLRGRRRSENSSFRNALKHAVRARWQNRLGIRGEQGFRNVPRRVSGGTPEPS